MHRDQFLRVTVTAAGAGPWRRAVPLPAGHMRQSTSRMHASRSYSQGFKAELAAPWPAGLDIEVGARAAWLDRPAFLRCFLSERERAGVQALPAEYRGAALLAIWTQKEALGKALGVGLAYPLSQVTTCFRRPGRWYRLRGGPHVCRIRLRHDVWQCGQRLHVAVALADGAASPP